MWFEINSMIVKKNTQKVSVNSFSLDFKKELYYKKHYILVYLFMFRIKQKNVPEGPCFACRIIRSFILASIMLLVLGLLASEKMHYLRFLTTEMIASVILVLGFLLFVVKLWLWLRERKSDSH